MELYEHLVDSQIPARKVYLYAYAIELKDIHLYRIVNCASELLFAYVEGEVGKRSVYFYPCLSESHEIFEDTI